MDEVIYFEVKTAVLSLLKLGRVLAKKNLNLSN